MYYRSFNTYLQETFGERVQKIPLDAGFTCPNRDGTKGTGGCIYCDARGSGTGKHHDCPDPAEQLRSGMDFFERRYKARKFIAYFQSFCNTHAPLEKLKAAYDAVAGLPGVVGLAVATRPDCLSPDIMKLLSGYAERMELWLELGLQSVHDSTLERINRGHTYNDFLQGYTLARHYPVRVCVHVIIGLPHETRRHIIATARELARIKPDAVKIHSLYIHRHTRIEELYRQGRFRPLEQQEYAQLACDMLEQLPPHTVIQRLTGDPDPARLVAPAWSMHKNKTLQIIEREMVKRGSRQGALHGVSRENISRMQGTKQE